ncbi:MAG: ABC transporter permease [Alphaproteobacteria bacterium]
MKEFLLKRLGITLLMMITVSFLLFVMLESNVEALAITVLGQYSSVEQRELWLVENGFREPFFQRYFMWLINFFRGEWGDSLLFQTPVYELVMLRLGNTGMLTGAALLFLVPVSLLLGVIAGIKEGSLIDRFVSVFSIFTTSVPDYASAVLMSFIFVFTLKWLPGTSSMISGFSWLELILPTLVLSLYAKGYLTRMTRASMAEVMQTHYVRTAFMKGVPYWRVVFKHALRNSMIAPFTAIMLQIPWLLSGVVVVETYFAYKGFGDLLLKASLANDIFLIEACAMISVIVVVATQLISDVAYVVLNPKITFTGGEE